MVDEVEVHGTGEVKETDEDKPKRKRKKRKSSFFENDNNLDSEEE